MMKVGVNARTFTVDEPGGAVQTSIKHTKGLIERDDTDVVLFGAKELELVFPDTPLVTTGYPVPSQMYGLLWERVALPTLADRSDIDVLYCPNGNAPATRTSCPVVMCIHDVNALKGWSSGVHQLYRKTTVPRGAKLADTITTVSEFSKGEIVQHLNVPESKVSVVYNGVDESFFTTKSEPLDGLPENYLLFVGSMNPRKNLERVVKSYVAIKEQTNLPHELVIIGPENKNIFKGVDIESRDNIVTPGFVTEEELKFAYENADVFVFPSLYEGFGLPPLEALACGTPVVASETTSLGEILQKGCILVDPEDVQGITDAIVQILEDEQLARNLITQGKAYAREFTWKNATKQLRDVLSKTV
ncbi:glycosyltransferase family 1 protein [Haloprofundus sp. MHR1]|uniref:glycosyltransferase family 4 protein n=1 Tax=Haloprofundus sp. MHR1 TaxID=2572921 RepID=UPI0010BEF80E|nr:glycosyltransferase family 1 protein [Haloprofundus sp. MHR1]QCJ45969.1 glycosyltransferase family 4 protein [Haloprofundus sp. MHR1]